MRSTNSHFVPGRRDAVEGVLLLVVLLTRRPVALSLLILQANTLINVRR